MDLRVHLCQRMLMQSICIVLLHLRNERENKRSVGSCFILLDPICSDRFSFYSRQTVCCTQSRACVRLQFNFYFIYILFPYSHNLFRLGRSKTIFIEFNLEITSLATFSYVLIDLSFSAVWPITNDKHVTNASVIMSSHGMY